MKKFSFFLFILLGYLTNSFAGTVLSDSWSNVVNGRCSDQNTAWWSSAEALRITENVLLYQKNCGGWTKNINMQLVLTAAQKTALIADKPKNTDCCIDNGAVTYELLYLSKVYKAISNDSIKNLIKNSFTKGIQYFLNAQYANGGWPQFYPYRGGYSNHITYNDNAMVNVMNNLRYVFNKDSYYSIILPDSIINRARTAFDKGVECILKTQYVQQNKYTVWCAQHDYKTLVPVMARSYELASLSGAESAGIIKLLMSLNNPSKEIKRSVYSSVAWYDRSRIKGQKLESFTNSDGLSDKRVVADANAADMWARFYTLTDNWPFFCDRDGIMKFSLAEIGYERRNGYSWYSSSGFDVINSYNTWLPKWGTTILASPLPDATFNSVDSVPVMAFANKYTGSSLLRFDLLVDSVVAQTGTSFTLNTSLKGLAAGTHTVIVQAVYAGGKTESDTCLIQVKAPSAISTVHETVQPLICFSNPLTKEIKVQLTASEIAEVQIFNSCGRLIYQYFPHQSAFKIHEPALQSGFFVIRVKDLSGRVFPGKVVL